MKASITGTVPADPASRVLAVASVARAICEQHGLEPAEAIMMLLTAASHISRLTSDRSLDARLDGLALALGGATVAEEDFFKKGRPH